MFKFNPLITKKHDRKETQLISKGLVAHLSLYNILQED